MLISLGMASPVTSDGCCQAGSLRALGKALERESSGFWERAAHSIQPWQCSEDAETMDIKANSWRLHPCPSHELAAGRSWAAAGDEQGKERRSTRNCLKEGYDVLRCKPSIMQAMISHLYPMEHPHSCEELWESSGQRREAGVRFWGRQLHLCLSMGCPLE